MLIKSTARFILTMWYVNGIGKDKSPVSLSSFILTMWYVNWIIAFTLCLDTLVLY